MQRSSILKGLILAAFAGVFASQVASCTLETEGKQTPVVKGAACTVDANCDDKNPCTTEVCPPATLVCEYTEQAMDGPAPVSAQEPEDCQKIVCTGGEPSTVDDPQDVKNDNNSCTTDACVGGKPTNDVLTDGTSCTQGNKTGQCETGTCTITCANINDCNDGNACSEDSCNAMTSKCVFTFLDGVPTPGFTEVVGNCKLRLCLNGEDKEINDDADVNDDNNPCTFDVCNNGVPENPNVPDATACTPGDANVCDGNGACVECTAPSHCVGIPETECEKRNCVNNKCEIAYEGQGTLASPVLQDANDCKKVVCNGSAGTLKVNDDADLPNDGKPCTTDTCSNGTPVFTNNAQGTSCGNNQVCNATGGCVGCNAPTDCAGTDSFCQTRTCINNVCGLSFTANGTDLPNGQTAGDCKVLECNGMGNVKTSVEQNDRPNDGNQCTQDLCNGQGTPSNPPTPINSTCSVGMNNACDGNGTCKKSIGTACGAGNECVLANCVDGVCCNNSCATTCQSCNVAGKLGTCSDVPKGGSDNGCSGANQGCNGPNNCDFVNGQTCAAASACLSDFCVDGVCCNSACDVACRSCAVTGTVGTCSNLPAGSQDSVPTNLCIGSSQCDNMGICKKVVGTTCNGATECLSGNCVDGVCCSTACTGLCQACSNGKTGMTDGTCSPVTAATDPDNDCTDQMASSCGNNGLCDGAGACQKYPMGTECVAQSCTGSTQTNASTCNNMNMCTGGGGTMNCAPYNCFVNACGTTCNGDGDCTSANFCAGNACVGKKSNGQACAGSNQCTSNFCVDGVCCENACTTTCQACNLAGNGTCTNIPAGTNDTFPMACPANQACNGGGGGGPDCDLVNGQPCTSNGQCISNKCMNDVCVP